jgi:hypothetical protein
MIYAKEGGALTYDTKMKMARIKMPNPIAAYISVGSIIEKF